MKKSKRGTPPRRKRAKSVQLVVRDPAKRLPQVMPMSAPAPMALLTEPVMMAAFVGTLKLTKEQIDALRRPVADTEIEWRPRDKDGPAIIPYLSHNGYRDRLDAAFGLGGWGMVPVGMPRQQGEDFIFTPYALVVDGVPRVYAWGEQQKFKMSYGDALEGAQSNAITRCGKALGIARELWDKGYVAALLKRKGKAPAADGAPRQDARADEPITDAQKIRLWTIVKKIGRPTTEVAMWLTAKYGLIDSAKIRRADYDAIIKAIEAPGRLPAPASDHDQREPGEEG